MSLQDAIDRITKGIHSQGRQQDVEDAIVNVFRQQFHRDPTEEEFASAAPAFEGSGGSAYVAQYKRSIDQSPEGQKAADLAKYNADPQKWGGLVDQYFKTSVNRNATDAEKKHFGSLLAAGKVDEYGLTNFLNNLPEATHAKDQAFQQSQRAGLEQADTQYYTDKLLPAIQAQMAQSGRSLESSGYASALAQAAKQQAKEREKYLTSLSASQYQGREGNARSDYESYINQLGQNQQRNWNLQDALTKRQNEYADFNQQREAYNQYLAQYGKRKNSNMAGFGSLAGMGIGALLAAPTGGMSIPMGAMLGGSIGGAGGGIWDSYR